MPSSNPFQCSKSQTLRARKGRGLIGLESLPSDSISLFGNATCENTAVVLQPRACSRISVSLVVAKASTERLAVRRTNGSSSPTRRAVARKISNTFPRKLKDHQKPLGVVSPPPTGPHTNGTGSKPIKLGIEYFTKV